MEKKLPEPPRVPAPGALLLEPDFAALAALCKREERPVTARRVKGAVLTGADLSGLSLSGVVLEGCRLLGCRLEADFTDVLVQGCDLSNCVFTDAYFLRTAFVSCKGVGAVFSESRLRQVTMERSAFSFANFDGAKGDRLHLKGCKLDCASLSACELRRLVMEETDFTGASFFKTPLAGLDFTSCTIEGMQVSSSLSELKGAVVTAYQAAGLAKLMGLVIR